jgi:effector-binding domain-containing protein
MRALFLVCLLSGIATADPPIEVITLDVQPAIAKTITAAPDALSVQIGGAVLALVATADRHGLVISGPPFSRTVSRGARVEVEVGLPVRKAPAKKLDKGVRGVELPAGPAATLLFRGRHQDLPTAHAALDTWLARNEREAASPRWEVYVTNPVTTPDPAAQQTRIVAPLAARRQR